MTDYSDEAAEYEAYDDWRHRVQARRRRRGSAEQAEPHSITGPVIPAHRWKGHPDNIVQEGWGYEIYVRSEGIIGSWVPRVYRSKAEAARARRRLIESERWYNETYLAGQFTIHDCDTDKKLLATIRKFWG